VPTPRLTDGTVNFGRVAGEKGIWQVPYITNMGDRLVDDEGKPLRPQPQRGAGGGGRAGLGGPLGGGEGTGGGRGRGGAKSEPWVPFQPWAAAVYDYNSRNDSKYDPEGYCLPPGGPRMMATPYPAEIIQLPEQKRVIMIFEGATHIWREIFMDGRPHPSGGALNRATRLLGGPLQGDARRRNRRLRGHVARLLRPPHQATASSALHAPKKGTLRRTTVDDPGAYTKPFKMAWDVPWNGGGELRYLPGKQQVPEPPDGRLRPADLRT
jgi:hypothetical protein